jgi:hypothetical protein
MKKNKTIILRQTFGIDMDGKNKMGYMLAGFRIVKRNGKEMMLKKK